jgi:uncharacterized protein YndB with AHSA1/START domain
VNRPPLTIEVPPDEPLIVWRRFVQAPPHVVFDAWTRPEHLRNWWGPRWLELLVCEVDLRVGGGYRFVQRAPDGAEHSFHGTYLEIDPPRRLVTTFVYEGGRGHEAVDAIDFEPVTGGTLLHGRSEHDSIDARDAHVEAGMEEGMADALTRLDEWSIIAPSVGGC